MVMKVIDSVLTVLVPTAITAVGLFQVLLTGDWQKSEGKKEALAAGRKIVISRGELKGIIEESVGSLLSKGMPQNTSTIGNTVFSQMFNAAMAPTRSEADDLEDDVMLEDEEDISENKKVRLTRVQLRKIIREAIK